LYISAGKSFNKLVTDVINTKDKDKGVGAVAAHLAAQTAE
jgi:hypothetical protein